MQSTPFFKDVTPAKTRAMRFFFGANLAVILFCAFYLARYFFASGLGWPGLISAIVVGYFLGDFASGAVHWAIDTWFDDRTLGRAIVITREHHTHPDHVHGYGFVELASLGSAPSAAVIGLAAFTTALFEVSALTYVLMIIWFVIATCLLFGMSFHNLAHGPARSPVLRLAQRCHLVCPPPHHWVHHRDQTIHYCVVNGWANYVCDRLHIWRGLERLIVAVTGLVPRADDHAWQDHYRETGTLSAPPKVHS